MKITYIKLVNVAGISVGSNRNILEISFEKAKNKIVAIQGPNGIGKSVLISSLTPFSGVTSVDDRSSLSYIIPKKDGYKEIHYDHKGDKYIIKHYYKHTKDDGHTVKSYFMKNGEELNENGNVTSCIALIEMHLGLTQEMMRLVRLGTNVNSFITLTPARRKEYIGKLIDEIDLYLKIYKKINDDIRVVKVMLASNNTNLYNCHISDLVVEENKLSDLAKEIKSYEKDRDKIVSKIGKIQSLINDNNIEELRHKKQEAEVGIREFDRTSEMIHEMKLDGVTVDQLITKRNDLSNRKIDVQSKINSYRISIDNTLRSIERLEINVKKITSDYDIQSLMDAISTLRDEINSTSKIITGFNPLGSSSDDVYYMMTKLSSLNQIGQMIYTLGNKPVDVYLKLKVEKRSVDKFLKDQMKNNLSRLNENDLKMLFDQVFQDDEIITPNCDTQFTECPYYRFSEVITKVRDKLEEESYDDETLRYIQVVSNNIDNILNELDRMVSIKVPDSVIDELKEGSILKKLTSRDQLFDLSNLQEYLSILKEYEIYKQNLEKLKQYEHQLSIYKKSGVDSHLTEIKTLRENIDFYKNNITSLEKDIAEISDGLVLIDKQIALVTKYNDGKKYRKIFESTLETTNKILGPLESATNEKMELEFQLRQMTNAINMARENHKQLESRINEYNRLVKEGIDLSEKHKDLSRILESTSTKKGIPVIYMKRYLGKIKKLANELLQIIYDDELRLAKFEVNPDTFEVPYIKNGTKIPDVKYASQSEVALITMALSFAIANKATGEYNILMLDEIDAGLDETNRSAFLKMLYTQMNALNAEQVFVISHNLSQMVNVPMDCIKLVHGYGTNSRFQNVIYEAS